MQFMIPEYFLTTNQFSSPWFGLTGYTELSSALQNFLFFLMNYLYIIRKTVLIIYPCVFCSLV